MSVQALSWVLDHSEAEYGARLVLISIANHCDKNGTGAWPKLETIAEESKLSVREVSRTINILVSLGELSVEKGTGKVGRNTYTLSRMNQPANLSVNHLGNLTNATSLPDKCDTSPRHIPQRNKEEPSLTVHEPSFSLSPPSSEDGKALPPPKKEKIKDPRFQPFIDYIRSFYKKHGWAFSFDARDGARMKALLVARPEWGTDELGEALRHYFSSDGVVQGGLLYVFLGKLPQYESGPLDRYMKVKHDNNEVALGNW
jgi:hypothetical protein